MASMETKIKDLAFKFRHDGAAGIDRFSKGVAEEAREFVNDVLVKAGPEVATAYAETTMDAAKIAAKEALTGVHQPREWAQIRVQYAALKVQELAILQAKTQKFLGSVVGLLGGVMGEVGGKWAEAAATTISGLFDGK